MTGQALTIEEVKNRKDLMAFIRFPWKIYRGNRYWVPPLIKDLLSKFSPSHPFRSHSERALFLAYRQGERVGRIACIIDHHYIEFQRRRSVFPDFESVDDVEVSDALLKS
jgi:hypothetical protein